MAALAIVCSASLAALVSAAPAPATPPAPELGPSPSVPSEPDASEDELVGPQPAPSTEPESGTGSIEFAVPPPEDTEDSEAGSDAPGLDPLDESQWPDPGTAPNDGIGAIVSGAILIPVASLATWALLDGQRVSIENNNVPIVVAGTGFGLIGAGLIGLGVHRRVKLRRWEGAYRVRATWQGNGMIAAGAIGINFGVVAALSGALVLARGQPGSTSISYGLIAAGIVTAGAIAPPMLVFGTRRKRRYQQTGGWIRPPLPPVPGRVSARPSIAPSIGPSIGWMPGGLTVGIRGHF